MIKKSLLFVMFIISILGFSCSDTDKVTMGGGPDKSKDCSSGIWGTLKSSSDSVISDSTIQGIVSDLCSNSSKISMYKGGSSVDVITLDEQDLSTSGKAGYSYVYMLGGVSIDDVGAEDYFNMMKLQAKDDKSFSTSNGYQLDSKVTEYKAKSKSDSKVKFFYNKDVSTSKEAAEFKYDGIANFVKVSDELYVVVNTLDKNESEKDVSSLYSISVISGSSSVEVYLGMKQKANNYNQHDTSIKNMKTFFKEDAKRSYHNAKNYKSKK